MVVHEGVPCEKLATIRALVAGRVGRYEMPLHRVLRYELLRTFGTVYHFIAMNSAHVCSQIYIPREFVFASHAFVYLSYFVSTGNVRSQIRFRSKGFSTVHAYCFVICVSAAHMPQ